MRLISFELEVSHGSWAPKQAAQDPCTWAGGVCMANFGKKKKTWLKSLLKINGNSTCETNTMLYQLYLNKKYFSISKGKDCPQTSWQRPRIYRKFPPGADLGSPSSPDWLLATGWGVEGGSRIREGWFCFWDPSRDGAIKTRMNSCTVLGSGDWQEWAEGPSSDEAARLGAGHGCSDSNWQHWVARDPQLEGGALDFNLAELSWKAPVLVPVTRLIFCQDKQGYFQLTNDVWNSGLPRWC